MLSTLKLDDSAGVETGSDPVEVFKTIMELLSQHRAWDRFPTTGRLA